MTTELRQNNYPSRSCSRPNKLADVVDKATRSRMMAGIQGRDTLPEITVRKFLHKEGFRFRLHEKRLPGKPDIVLPRYRAVVLVHGCFWHQHEGCRFATKPRSNVKFWRTKLRENVLRDARNLLQLRELGWRPLVFWECAARDTPQLRKLAANIRGRSAR